MYIDVVVSPKSGQPVAGLQRQDFTLLDNKAQQTIASFKEVNGRDAAIEAVVMIDAVNAGAQTVDFERIQIDKFLRAEGGHLPYPIALEVFTISGIQVVADFSNDGNALSAELQKANTGLRVIGRSAGFYGAVERLEISIKALTQLAIKLASDKRRKIVLWISPGWPLLSGATAQMDAKQHDQIFASIVGMSSLLQQSSITLYSIDPRGAGEPVIATSYYEDYLKGVIKPSQAEFANLALQVLAVQNGGLAVNSSNNVAGLLNECLAKSAPYYEISFDAAPTEKRDEYHHIEIKLAKAGLTAHTRQGYYAEP